MTASVTPAGRVAVPSTAPRLAGFRALARKDLAEWTRGKRVWVIASVTTVFLGLTAANGAITSWIVANVPDATTQPGPISLDPATNFLAAVATQFAVMVAIFASMSLLIAERERGTLSWVASKPVSRGAIWLSKWASAVLIIAIVGGLIPLVATFGLVAGLYGPAGLDALVIATLGVAASIAFITAVVLAASTIVSNQAAVAAIGFAVFFLPQLLVGLLPIDVSAYLPTSILAWTIGLAAGADVGVVTPIVWAVSIVVLAAIAIRRMDVMEL
jgi:ABC-type transport system involved in multi-copper enzyme maturation permease subunit